MDIWAFLIIEKGLPMGLEAQLQRHLSYRAVPVLIIPQNCLVFVFMGYRKIIVRYVGDNLVQPFSAKWRQGSRAQTQDILPKYLQTC